MNQQNKFLFTAPYLPLLILLTIIWVCVLWLFHYVLGSTPIEKIPKRELVKYYGVDRKTMGKWIKYFCTEQIDFTTYKQQRKLEINDYLSIIIQLGNPNEMMILSKRDIIKMCEGSYTSLRNSIDAYPEKFGISGATFRKLHKFPPAISQQILEQYD